MNPFKDNRIEEFYHKYMHSLKSAAPAYGLLYFDQLHSEYTAIRSSVDPDSQERMDGLHQRRTDDQSPLTWGDIYLFDLDLLKWLPSEALISKAYDMRSRYRNVAGEKEYDLYVASKPPDISKIAPVQDSKVTPQQSTENVAPNDQAKVTSQQSTANVAPTDQLTAKVAPQQSTANVGVIGQSSANVTSAQQSTVANSPTAAIEQETGQLTPEFELALREDIKYLLKVFYLDYSLMKVREGVREQLMRKGTIWTLWALAAVAFFIVMNDFGSKVSPGSRFYIYTRGLTIGVVVAAGCVGGLMSMLHRILNAPNEGDALFNLASLTNGWRSIFLAPLTGAVFSVLLFVLFAAGVLKGTVFPDIYTPSGRLGSITQIRPDSRPTPSPAVSPERATEQTPLEGGEPVPDLPPSHDATPATGIKTPKGTPSPVSAKQPVATPIPSPSPSATPSPSPAVTDSLAFSDFIQQTGPTSGINYALLIIWSFLAGFLERLVPDALTKLVAKSDTGS